VADAAFGSIEMLEKITTWGGSATILPSVMPWISIDLRIKNHNLGWISNNIALKQSFSSAI